MSKKKPRNPVDKRAVPAIKKRVVSDAAKIQVTRSTSTAMHDSPLWPGAPRLQSAVAVWNGIADAIGAKATAIRALQKQLDVLFAELAVQRRDWLAARKHVIAEADFVAGGSADALRAMGLDVVVRTGKAQAKARPGPIRAELGTKPGEAIFSWPRGDARRGFMVQSADDVSRPATYAPLFPWKKTRFTVTGAAPSSVVHVRIAAIDSSTEEGISEWSDWAAGTAR
jgi:hypothetical protein